MDLKSIMKDHDQDSKKQPRHGIICIDIFSKKTLIVPMKERDGETVNAGLMECFKVWGQPLSIYSDDDGI